MTEIYQHPKTHRTIRSCIRVPTKEGDYLYFIRLVPISGCSRKKAYKIGTTNGPLQRMKEHLRYYKYEYNIEILWISPTYSKYTTLRIEDRMKNWWIEQTQWEYIRNDRFIIPDDVKEIIITVRKDYIIQI